VFNPGERVEGYTNFLWTIMMALAIKLHLDPGQFSLVLGILCFLVVLLCVDRWVRREAHADVFPLSIAAILLGASYTFASFATSGLETMFATLLVLLALER